MPAQHTKEIQNWIGFRKKMLLQAQERKTRFAKGSDKVLTPYAHVMIQTSPAVNDFELRNFNTANRLMNSGHVEDFAAMIRKAEIQPVPSRIIVCDDGTIGDGQHILDGSRRANQPITVEWTFGVPRELMLVIDSQIKARTARDVTHIGHSELAKESKTDADLLASVGTLYDWITCGAPLGLGDSDVQPYRLSTVGLNRITHEIAELQNHLKDGRRIADAVTAGRVADKKGMLRKGYRAAFATGFAMIERASVFARRADSLVGFKDQLEHATGQEYKNTPVLCFREAILLNKIAAERRGKRFEEAVTKALVFTWSLWAKSQSNSRGRQTTSVKAIGDAAHAEAFPAVE